MWGSQVSGCLSSPALPGAPGVPSPPLLPPQSSSFTALLMVGSCSNLEGRNAASSTYTRPSRAQRPAKQTQSSPQIKRAKSGQS